jgi:hypothetical protein
MAADFDWNNLDPDEKVQSSVQAVAVYLNPANDIVIRQQADWPHENEDAIIVLSKPAAMRLASRLRALFAEAE